MGFLGKSLQVQEKDVSLIKRIYISFFGVGIVSTLIGALLPFMKAEYNMDYVLSGAVISAHQIGNFCAVLFSGFLPYVIGRKKSTVLLVTGIPLGFLLVILTGIPGLLLFAFVLTGIGRGTMSNISNVTVSETSGNRTAALNILHASFAVGALSAPFLVILFTQVLHLDWRFPAIFIIVFEIGVLLLLAKSSLSNVPVLTKKEEKAADKKFLTSPIFWLNTSILFMYLCCESGIVGWLVTYFKESGGLSESLSQSTASLLWIMILAGRLLCAIISEKMNKAVLIVSMAIAQIVFFLLMILSSNMILIFIGLLGTGFAMSGFYPTVLSTMPKEFTSSTIATGTCIATATIGAIIMPIVIGAIAEVTGIAGGISAIGVALGICVLLTIIKLIISYRVKKD
jgi:fucose permease